MKEFTRVAKFVLFSISAGLIEIGAFALFNEVLKFPYWLSYLLALILSVLWNFTLNRKFTFKSAVNIPIAMLKVAAYYAVFTPLSTLLEHWLTTGLGWNEYIVTGINMLINLATEFLYQRFFVFGKTLDTNQKKKEESESEEPAEENPSSEEPLSRETNPSETENNTAE
ncbi:MAG: GtrA family protein [Parasporobacterium sp.]|nr:GtrA family protein [Parasporobacterium sp.]